MTARPFSLSEGHLPMTFREEFWIVRRWISQNRSAGQTGIIFLPDPSGKLVAPGAADRGRTAGGPAQSGTISLRGRLCDHTLLCQHAAGPDQCRDGTLLCPGSADGLSGDFGTEAALQALVFRRRICADYGERLYRIQWADR